MRTNILELTRANCDFQPYAADAEELTLRREHRRISREIHDRTGCTMTTPRMMLEVAADLVDQRFFAESLQSVLTTRFDRFSL